jgi:hypothetical protein
MVSRWLSTVAARARAQVKSCWICSGQSGTGADFLRVLRFFLPILIPPTAPHSSSCIIRGWYYRPISGQRKKWTKSQRTSTKWKEKKNETKPAFRKSQKEFRVSIWSWGVNRCYALSIRKQGIWPRKYNSPGDIPSAPALLKATNTFCPTQKWCSHGSHNLIHK